MAEFSIVLPKKIVWKILKYQTGDTIPNDAKYVYSREEKPGNTTFVWHYFMVQVEE